MTMPVISRESHRVCFIAQKQSFPDPHLRPMSASFTSACGAQSILRERRLDTSSRRHLNEIENEHLNEVENEYMKRRNSAVSKMYPIFELTLGVARLILLQCQLRHDCNYFVDKRA